MRFTTLKRLRLERDMLQLELARRVEINPSRLCLIENGHVQPKDEELKRIAAALGVSPEHLGGSAAREEVA